MRHESSDPSFKMSTSLWSSKSPSKITKNGHNHSKRAKVDFGERMFLLNHSESDSGEENDDNVLFSTSSVPYGHRHDGRVSNNIELSNRVHNRSSPEKRKIYSDHVKLNKFDLIEKRIEDGDTLQSLSLKYGVTVFQLKRANNMIADQEFYGLQIIKIPVLKHGIHSKSAEDLLVSFDDGANSSNSTQDSSILPKSKPRAKRLSSLNSDQDMNNPDIKQFIQSLDQDLKDLKDSAQKVVINSVVTNSGDVPVTILAHNNGNFHPFNSRIKPKMDGADCGLTFWHVLLLVIIVCILIPIIYIYMIEEKQLELHNQTE